MPPAIGLIAAVGSVGAGMAAVGGTMAGFAAAGIGTQLMAGAMIAGGVMTGIGVLTGSKKLQKWGGILGLAGGIAGLASGAWSSTASSVAEEAARESFRASELGAQAAAGGDLVGSAAGGLGEAASSLVQANAGAGLGVSDIGVGGASAGSAQPWQTPGINPGANPGGPSITAPSVPSSVNLGSAGGSMQTLTRGAAAAGGDTGMLSGAMSWMEKNPKLTQAGAGLLTAGLSAYGQQEAIKEQMRMQEEQQARARKRLSDSVQGVTVPVYQRRGG